MIGINQHKVESIIHKLSEVVKDEKELEDIKSLLEQYFEALGPIDERNVKDLNRLKELQQQLFEFEKKYLPLFPENKNISEKIKPENLILTVGLQPAPVILSILCLKPKNVFLLHTDESVNQVSAIKQDKYILNLGVKIECHKITEYDVNENYKVMKDLIERISSFSKSILVDPTGGRKMMIASVSLASFYYKLPMVYMHSEDLKGQILPFSDRVRLITNPLLEFGDTDLSLVENLFNSHMYEAAVKVMYDLTNAIRDAELAKKYELLKELLEVYRDWDLFKHSDPVLKENLSKRLDSVIKEMEKFKLDQWLPENVKSNLKFLQEAESKYREGSFNLVDEYRIVDVYLSAIRRGSVKQGKYDDAIARLYRCIDMCSTYILKNNFNLDSTEYPHYSRIAKKINRNLKEIKDEFKNKYRYELPNQKLGVDVQMKLIAVLDPQNNLPKIYSKMEELMKMRNRSILAHGTKPLTENDWSLFRDKTLVIIKQTIGEEKFNEIFNMAKHGKISLKP